MNNIMNIERRTQQILVELQQLRAECEFLIERTHSFEEDLLKVKTEEEAKQYDATHDLEEGLNIISLS